MGVGSLFGVMEISGDGCLTLQICSKNPLELYILNGKFCII